MISLNDVFKSIAEKMQIDFEKTHGIPHNLTKGEARESSVVESFLGPRLPKRYAIGTGLIIDTKSRISKQQDIIIYDAFYSPLLENLASSLILFPESVFATIEVKSTLTKAEILDMVEKNMSVLVLEKSPSHLLFPPSLFQGPKVTVVPQCLGFCYESQLSLGQIKAELKNLEEAEGMRPTLSFICVLRDKTGKSGLVVHVDGDDMMHIQTVPVPPSKYGIIECNHPGEALLYMYLFLMQHLQGCASLQSFPDLLMYAKSGGLDETKIAIDVEEMGDSHLTIDGNRVRGSFLKRLQFWQKKLRDGTMTDEEILEWFHALPEFPQGHVITDPRSRIYLGKSRIESPTPSEIYDATSRSIEGTTTVTDKELLTEFCRLVRQGYTESGFGVFV